MNFSCRDRNRFALKSDLIGAAAARHRCGGGADRRQDSAGWSAPARAPSHDLDAFALLRMVADLNRGDTGEGKALLKKLPEIFVGAVANPNRQNHRP